MSHAHRVIVMTGASSGFGALALAQLLRQPHLRVLAGSRSPAADQLPLDLASLDSVRRFAAGVVEATGGAEIDVLVLNAGMILGHDEARTGEGFERTFAVNYLTHYLLVRLLAPALASGARVILTTSGTHDPSVGAGLVTPRHADAGLLAHPELDPQRNTRPAQAGQHAYTASKLCAVLLVRALASQPRSKPLTAIAFDPGQVFGTSLARGLRLPLRLAWSAFGTPLGAPLRWLQPTQNTSPAAARALVGLALGTSPAPPCRSYAALRRGRLTWPDPSELARDPDVAQKLWTDSAHLVGLPARQVIDDVLR